MNKVIQLLESTKQKQEESLKQLPKMVDKHVATVSVEGEQFIKEIDQALLVLSNVVGRSEQFYCLSDPIEGGVKRCKTQCRGCENSENVRK